MTVRTIRGVEERAFVAREGGTSNVLLPQVLGGPVVYDVPNAPLQGATEGFVVHFVSRDTVLLPEIDRNPGRLSPSKVSLFMHALHGAFAEHIPFSLSPEMAWYLIAHEVAVHVRQNEQRYRGHFTASTDRETIVVRDDSLRYGVPNQWGRSINLVREPMAAVVPEATIDIMLPKFTTSTLETDTALLVLFLDMLSNYYDMVWYTRCGIPRVRVEGTPEDWRTVINHAELAQREFAGLKPYFDDLIPVLGQIADSVAGQEVDPEFWKSIYKYDGMSGGPFINGWITAFFAHRMTESGFILRTDDLGWRDNARNTFRGFTAGQLPLHLTTVPFVWDYFGTNINMAFIAGVMGVEHDGYLNPRLGYGVLEDVQGKLSKA